MQPRRKIESMSSGHAGRSTVVARGGMVPIKSDVVDGDDGAMDMEHDNDSNR